MFATKYRREVFAYDMLNDSEDTLRGVCAELDTKLAEFKGETDHEHLLVSYPPTLAISILVRRRIGATAHRMRQDHTGGCNRARMNGQFRTPSYFAASPPRRTLSIIKQYIEPPPKPL